MLAVVLFIHRVCRSKFNKMCKFSMVAITLLALISCSNETEIPSYKTGIILDNTGRELVVYTIDSCEYIGNKVLSSNTAILTHKGNCKFCNSRNKK